MIDLAGKRAEWTRPASSNECELCYAIFGLNFDCPQCKKARTKKCTIQFFNDNDGTAFIINDDGTMAYVPIGELRLMEEKSE